MTGTATGATDALVVCHGASRSYGQAETRVVAVHGVTCTVRAGDRVALVGPSGSGKSTLIQLLAGLDHPTSGTVRWPGREGDPHPDPSHAAVVFQTDSLVPTLTARENVAFPLLLRGVGDSDATTQALDALAHLGIAALADRPADHLSGGQAQRVAVARAVAASPRLILADEPTGRLDRATAEEVIQVLTSAADHLGAGLVVFTHDPVIAEKLADTWTMRDGELQVPVTAS